MIEGAPAQGLDAVIGHMGPDPDQTIKHDRILDELERRFIDIDTRAIAPAMAWQNRVVVPRGKHPSPGSLRLKCVHPKGQESSRRLLRESALEISPD